MNRMEAIAWTLSVCASLRLSQAKTLSELGAATLHVSRVSLAETGRRLQGEVAAKHRIKRVWRFTTNTRVEISDAMRGVVAGLRKGRCEAREPEPVRPVPMQHVYAVQPFVSRQVWAMIQVQLLTAVRPDANSCKSAF